VDPKQHIGKLAMTKFCVDCKHCFENIYNRETMYECHHPKSLIEKPLNLVTGYNREEWRTCEYQRHHQRGSAEDRVIGKPYHDGTKMSDYSCTKDGAWFEPKLKPETPPKKKSWWINFMQPDAD